MKPGAIAGSVWLAAALCLPGAVRADSAPLWPDAVDTVRVTAPRPFPEERIARPRGSEAVVPLGSSVPASIDLGDLLDGVAGVQVRRLGGVGAISLVSIRGSAPSQVEVRIDDIPVSAAADGIANLGLLPAHLFSRVEVGRGPLASTDGGSGAGVIRLITPERLDLPLSVRVGAGSFGSRSLAAAGGLSRGRASLLLSGGTLASMGNYPYLDRRSTPYESADDRIVRRSNNALDQKDLLVRARWSPAGRAGGLAVDYLLQGLWRDSGIPGTESRQTRNVHDRFRRLLQSIGLRAERGRDYSWKLAFRRQSETGRFRNPDGEIGLGRADTRSLFLAQGIDADLGRSMARGRTTLRVDGSLSRERTEQWDLLSSAAEPARHRDSRSLGVEAASKPLGERVDLFGSQRWTAASEAGAPRVSLAAPRLGGSVALARGLSLRCGWGRFGRLPSFVERFGRGGVQMGNPSLSPERGTSRDVGAVLRWPAAFPASGREIRIQIEVAGFETRTNDAIVWIQNSQRTTRAQNIERTRVVGAEMSLRLAIRPSRWIRLVTQQVTATVQDARDDGPSTTYHHRVLPYIPREKGAIETRIDFRAVHLTHRLDHESAMYRDRYNSPAKMRGARTLQDLEAGYAFAGERIELIGAVRNATNRRADDVEGFPLPGRSFSVEITFRPDSGKKE